jgi:hypothetical protein
VRSISHLSLPDCTGTWRYEKTQGWLSASPTAARCSRMYGGFVMPGRGRSTQSHGDVMTELQGPLTRAPGCLRVGSGATGARRRDGMNDPRATHPAHSFTNSASAGSQGTWGRGHPNASAFTHPDLPSAGRRTRPGSPPDTAARGTDRLTMHTGSHRPPWPMCTLSALTRGSANAHTYACTYAQLCACTYAHPYASTYAEHRRSVGRQRRHEPPQQLRQAGADVATVRTGVLAAQPDLADLEPGKRYYDFFFFYLCVRTWSPASAEKHTRQMLLNAIPVLPCMLSCAHCREPDDGRRRRARACNGNRRFVQQAGWLHTELEAVGDNASGYAARTVT